MPTGRLPASNPRGFTSTRPRREVHKKGFTPTFGATYHPTTRPLLMEVATAVIVSGVIALMPPAAVQRKARVDDGPESWPTTEPSSVSNAKLSVAPGTTPRCTSPPASLQANARLCSAASREYPTTRPSRTAVEMPSPQTWEPQSSSGAPIGSISVPSVRQTSGRLPGTVEFE